MTAPPSVRLRDRITRWLVAPVFVAVALGASLLVAVFLGATRYIFFWPAVLATAWFAGFGPAALASVLSVLAVDYWLVPPIGTISLADAENWLPAAVFVVMGSLVSGAADQLRLSDRRSRDAERDLRVHAEQLEVQASELEAQMEEAQALAEDLEQANIQLEEALEEAGRSREEAEHATRAMHVVFGAMPDPVSVYDREWRIVQLNPAAARRLEAAGVRPADVIGRNVFELFGDRVRHIADHAPQAEASGALVEYEERSQLTDARYLHRLIPTVAGFVLHSRDVSAERRREERRRVLAQAGALLAVVTQDMTATLERVTSIVVPELADWCSVSLARPDGGLVTAAVAHADPDKVRWARELNQRYPPDANAATGAARVLRTGEAEFYPVVTPEMLDAAAIDDDHRRVIREIGFTSVAFAPLSARGRTLGVLTLVTAESGRRYTEDDAAFTQELGILLGLAIDNAGLFAAEHAARAAAERTADRVQRLQRVTASLAPATSVPEVAAVIATEGLAALGADTAVVTRLTADRESLEIIHSTGLDADVVDRFRRVPIGSELPMSEAVRTGQAVFLETRAAVLARYRSIGDTTARVQAPAWVALPLLGEAGPLGGIAFGFAQERQFDDGDRGFAEALAHQCSIAVQRALAVDAERDARREAEDANRAKSDFLATMSHELRTPLNAIAGHAELVALGLHGPVTEAQLEAISRIVRNERHLLGLINDVLNFAKLEAGRVEFRPDDVPIRSAVDAVESLLSAQIGSRGLRFRSERVRDGIVAHADPEKLRQVLLNLLSNAIKFTPEGGAIDVAAEQQDGVVQIRVRDTGIGIPPDRLTDVFSPFVQLDRTHASGHEGTGLGLAISRDLARGMGGELTVESEVGSGSTFTLTLRSGSGDGRRGTEDR